MLVPLALPRIYGSLRSLFGLAFGYIMLAELINAKHGLGYLLSTSQRRGPHREHQGGHLGPVAHRQEIVDEDVRLDPDATHAFHQLQRGKALISKGRQLAATMGRKTSDSWEPDGLIAHVRF